MNENAARSTSDTFPGSVVLATRRLGEREWFVMTCYSDETPPATDGPPMGPRAELVIPIVLVAANAAQRARIVSDLKAHVQALVAPPEPAEDARVLATGELRFGRSPQRVTVDGREIALSGREFRVLDALIQRRNRVVSREELLREAWSGPLDEPTRRVDVMITRIRSKLGTAGRFIQSVRCVGYRFVEMAAIVPASGSNEQAGQPLHPVAAGVTVLPTRERAYLGDKGRRHELVCLGAGVPIAP